MQRIIENGSHLLPGGFGRFGSVQLGHGLIFDLPALSAILCPTRIGRHPSRAGVEPAGQGGMADQAWGFAAQLDKDQLS